uniref:SWIRM domain-containing protein n=1 Tax=Caenorhabditis tropicalis TaxID=1561998 RepID=A0A1I7TCG1_9PELO
MSSDAGSDYEEAQGEEFSPSTDENTLASAATQNRLPFDRPTEHELAFFPELWEHKTAVEIFLLIRNTTLATWQYNPLKECTALDVRNNVFPPFNSDLDLIQNIVHYLTRHGLINYGRYVRSTKINRFLVRDERKVIVIGSGAAGISAATQLTSFGFDVTILEARKRIGGRIAGFKTKTGELMETGADTLRNLENSPMATLLQQCNVDEQGVFDTVAMFLDGKSLPEERIKNIMGHYLTAKKALNWEAHQRDHRDERGMYVSRQQAYENLMNMCERSTLVRYYNHCKSLENIAQERESHYKQMQQCRNMAYLAENKLRLMEDHNQLNEDPLLRRSLKRDIATSLAKFNELADMFEVCDNHWIEMIEHPQPKQYMHPGSDFSTYNFMLGHEEYLYGANLERVQYTANAAQNKENGVASRVTEGVHELMKQIVEKRKLDIRLQHNVKQIDYSDKNRVKLTVLKANGQVENMTAAFVVSTLPIGVLKKTISNDKRAPTFTPTLPEKKVTAIKSIGSGLVNKCILEFDKPFWANSNRYQFATVSPNLKTRGSLCVWSSVPDSKVITAYMAGQEAHQSLPDDVLIQNAILNLQRVFGNQCPRVPVSAHITRWQHDEFAFGSGSFWGLATEPHHFDDLITPLETSDGVPRVYFAGEHTCPSYTSTVQGAWMSGARAAADMANAHNGVGFVDLSGSKKDLEGEELITVDRDGQMPEDMVPLAKIQRQSEPGTSDA